eukprot:scaffold22852_cov63-Attheya_sp.AAC.4
MARRTDQNKEQKEFIGLTQAVGALPASVHLKTHRQQRSGKDNAAASSSQQVFFIFSIKHQQINGSISKYYSGVVGINLGACARGPRAAESNAFQGWCGDELRQAYKNRFLSFELFPSITESVQLTRWKTIKPSNDPCPPNNQDSDQWTRQCNNPLNNTTTSSGPNSANPTGWWTYHRRGE